MHLAKPLPHAHSDRKWSPGEGGDGQQSQKELEGVEGEQDGAENELQPQDEGLQ